jgi:autotransporter-associated beta strand protein
MNLGNLAISGSVTCNITGTGFPVVNLTLFTYGSKTGGGSFVLGSLPPGAFAILTDDGANVVLNISSPSIQSLVWSTGDGIWKTNGSLNWNYGTATYREYPSGVNDVVTFDDSSGGGTVTIGSQVNPSATFVNVTGTPYTFVGEGSIGGTNGVALQGTASLTLCNSNNFSGPVTISGGSGSSGGTLYVSNSFALGTTAGATVVFGPANTLEIGAPGGIGIGVTNETVTISGAGVGGARGALRGAAVTSGDNVWAGPVIIAADQTRIGTEDSGNLTVAGPITDNGANLGVVFRCGANGVVTVSGSGSSYAYTRTYGDGSGTGTVRLGANNAFSTNALQLGLGQVDLNGFNQTFASITDNTGPGTVINNGAVPSTLTINTGTNSLSSFSTVGSIVDGSNVLNVIKTGKGNQTFAGPTVTYSGSTTIGGGQLTISSANPVNTAITVLAGGALGGEGTTTNSLVFQADSMLVVDPISLGSFTANMVDATAAPIKVNFTSSAPANTATLLLTAVNGFTGPASHFQSVGSRGGSFYYTNGNTQLVFVPSSVNASLSWRGNNPTNPTFWDTITTTNWSNGGAPDIFFAGDNVLFDDTASTYTVAIQGASVQPTSVTVNSTNDYSFTGVIGGNATLTKGGPGRLLLNNNNTYTGPTLITNGIINIQTSGGLGTSVTGTVISDFGTLDLGTGAALANTLNLGAEILTISGTGLNGMGAIVNNSLTADQINAVQKVVLAGNARIGGTMRWDMRGTGNALDMGAFTLTKVGDNYIALVGTAVSNPGNVVVQGGTFAIQTGADIGGSSANTLTLQGGAILNNYQTTIPQQWSLVMENNTTYQANNGSASQNIWAGPVTLNGAASLNVNAYLTISGSIAGSGSINKTGTGYATLSASNSYSGNTTVTAGTLELQQPTLAGGSTVTVAGNAVLNLTFDATNIISSLVLNGTNQPPGLYSAANAAPFLGGGGVLQVSPTAPPVLQVANLGNGQLQFSWTGNFKLQAQTNTLNIGISSNWVDYPGGAGSPVNVPVDVSRGSVFFRLISP